MCKERGLGDLVSQALSLVGITEERVSAWVGDCSCKERIAKLNQLGYWAGRVLLGHRTNARKYLDAILHDKTDLPGV